MRFRTFVPVFALLGLATSISVTGHDPSEHMAAAQAPDCAAIRKSNREQSHKYDPVAQAILKRCAGTLHDDDAISVEHDDEGVHDEGDGESDRQQRGTDQESNES
jgi:hypothetical protein